MENKLQELTKKLYDEGLSKGRQQADELLTQAREQAERIVAEAKSDAERIRKTAETSAEDLRKNTLTELNLAGNQVIDRLKAAITDMVVARIGDKPVAQANLDPEFVKEVLTEVARNWQGSSAEKVSLVALLPADKKDKLAAQTEQSAKAVLGEQLEIVYSDGVNSGFRIGPKEGGYYISFTDEGFKALLGEYLRPKVSEVLFGNK